jgi:hypothetical protein
MQDRAAPKRSGGGSRRAADDFFPDLTAPDFSRAEIFAVPTLGQSRLGAHIGLARD